MPDDSSLFAAGQTLPTSQEIQKKDGDYFEDWHPTEEEAADHMLALRRVEDDMLPAQAPFHREWDDAKEIHEAYITPQPNRPSVRIPWSHTIIDTALAEEVDAFPDIEIDTQEDDDRLKLPVLEACKKYALDRAGWDRVKMDARRVCRIYGLCPVRISYVRETRKIAERVPRPGDDGLELVTRDVFDYPEDDIKLEVIDNPRRFLIDDAARDITEAEDCALFTEVNWNVFRQKVQYDRRYKNVRCVRPGAYYSYDAESGGIAIPEADRKNSGSGRRVKILEYWNKALDKYVMIANGVVIRSTPLLDDHKELPFAVLHMYRRPHVFYSKGIPKLIESLEASYNAIIGAEVQATKLAFPILVTTDDAGIDPRAIAPYPGIVLEGALDKMDLKQLGAVPNEAYKLKQKIEELLIWTTGVNYQQLFSDKQSDRVGVEALKKESMLARVNANLRENEANFIVRLGNLLVQDIMQYYPGPKVRRLMSTDDLSRLATLSFERDGVQLVRDGDQTVGVMERRRVPVKGFRVEEDLAEDGLSYTMTKSRASGSILARPEYIRARHRLDIRAVRPSAMGSSKEARKLMFLELSNHALDVNAANMQMTAQAGPTGPDGRPTQLPGKPIWNLEFLERKLAEANELPPEKALVARNSEEGASAVEEMDRLASPIAATFARRPEQSVEAQESPEVAAMKELGEEVASLPQL